jgi:hypothetical protein
VVDGVPRELRPTRLSRFAGIQGFLSEIVSALDIYRTANLLIQQHGADNAKLHAAMRADRLFDKGDLQGLRTWQKVLKAIEEMISIQKPPPRVDPHGCPRRPWYERHYRSRLLGGIKKCQMKKRKNAKRVGSRSRKVRPDPENKLNHGARLSERSSWEPLAYDVRWVSGGWRPSTDPSGREGAKPASSAILERETTAKRAPELSGAGD